MLRRVGPRIGTTVNSIATTAGHASISPHSPHSPHSPRSSLPATEYLIPQSDSRRPHESGPSIAIVAGTRDSNEIRRKSQERANVGVVIRFGDHFRTVAERPIAK